MALIQNLSTWIVQGYAQVLRDLPPPLRAIAKPSSHLEELDVKLLKSYTFALILISSILLGGLVGHFWGKEALYLKPFGDIFLNLVLTMIVPLIFFSVSSAIARTSSIHRLGRLFGLMLVVFIITGVIAAIYALITVLLFPPALGVTLSLTAQQALHSTALLDQLVAIITVPDFAKLLSHHNLFALLIFSILIGLATALSKDSGQRFAAFLYAGEVVFLRVFSLIMLYAPIGFFAYFAVLVSELGSALIESYIRITLVYSISALIYFFAAYTFYAYLANKKLGVKLFWQQITLPATTALATCSSAASIPANLIASKAMGINAEVYETTIPLGHLIHKDGSVIGGVFKIAFLFGLFHMNFAGFGVLLTALAVALLVGTVMGAIPSGGMLGELVILNVYGFPPSVLIAIAAISILIDPMATLLNVTGNTASSLLINKWVAPLTKTT